MGSSISPDKDLGPGPIQYDEFMKQDLDMDLDVDLDVDLGVGEMLSFNDPLLERDFVSYMSTVWTRKDVAMLFIAMLGSMVEIYKIADQCLLAIVPQMVLLCGEGVLLSMILRDPDWYQRWRTGAMWLVKPVSYAVYGLSICYHDTSQIWRADTMPLFVMRSSVRTVFLPMIYNIMGGQLLFRHKISILVLSCGSFVGWVTNLDAACDVEDGVRSTIHSLGWMTEKLMIRIALLGFPSNSEFPALGEYPCWQVGVFYGIFIEILMPAFVIYLKECSYRIRFLKAQMRDEQAQKCNETILEHMTMAVVYLVVSSQVVWFTTRLIGGMGWEGPC